MSKVRCLAERGAKGAAILDSNPRPIFCRSSGGETTDSDQQKGPRTWGSESGGLRLREAPLGLLTEKQNSNGGASSIGPKLKAQERDMGAGPERAGTLSRKRLGQEQNGGHFWGRLWLSFVWACPRVVTLWGVRIRELKRKRGDRDMQMSFCQFLWNNARTTKARNKTKVDSETGNVTLHDWPISDHKHNVKGQLLY